jgi:hypothetical protein
VRHSAILLRRVTSRDVLMPAVIYKVFTVITYKQQLQLWKRFSIWHVLHQPRPKINTKSVGNPTHITTMLKTSHGHIHCILLLLPSRTTTPLHSTRNDHRATTADHCDTQATPGHQRRESQPLGTTQPTNNGHTMPKLLIHVFDSHHRSTHTPYFCKRDLAPPFSFVLTLSLMTVFK